MIKKYQGQYENTIRAVVCLNTERKALTKKKRDEHLASLRANLDKLFANDRTDLDTIKTEEKLNAIFKGHKKRFQKYFTIERDKKTQKAIGFSINKQLFDDTQKMDGIFVLTTNRLDLDKTQVVQSYKNLKEVESLFDDLKNFVDLNPVRHWLEQRVRAHVCICIFSLLFAPRRGALFRALRRLHFIYECRLEHILKTLWRSDGVATLAKLKERHLFAYFFLLTLWMQE